MMLISKITNLLWFEIDYAFVSSYDLHSFPFPILCFPFTHYHRAMYEDFILKLDSWCRPLVDLEHYDLWFMINVSRQRSRFSFFLSWFFSNTLVVHGLDHHNLYIYTHIEMKIIFPISLSPCFGTWWT